MSYTVYIPDAERGPTSYTQRQFATIKALARWAMEAALEEPISVSPPAERAPEIVQILADIEAATAPKQKAVVHKLPDIKDATGKVIASGSIEFPVGIDGPWLPKNKEDPTFKTRSEADRSLRLDTHLPTAPAKPAPAPTWEVDTDEWFTDVSATEWATPLRERNWKRVAEMYFEEIKQLFDQTPAHERMSIASVLSREDLAWFGKLACAYPQLFAENLFPETQVRWELLPVGFKDACVTWTTAEKSYFSSYFMSATHRFAKDAFAILAFLRKGQRHQSWEDISREAEEGIAWGGTSAEATAEKLLTMWWSGTKPTDAVREFMLRSVVLRYFKQSSAASTVGSSEFLTAYMDRVRRMGVDGVLPAGFLDWATRGTAFKHCKSALSSMGIASVRRADGQKYTNLAEIKADDDETWIFEDDLASVGDWYSAASFRYLATH